MKIVALFLVSLIAQLLSEYRSGLVHSSPHSLCSEGFILVLALDIK